MTWIAGADGCRDGWAVVLRDLDSGQVIVRVARHVGEILAWPEQVERCCLDIPIGLLDEAVPGGRLCDRAARRLLGGKRAGSVFSPPVRGVLGASSYEEALRLSRASSHHGLGISKQCFTILDKIRQVDEHVTPALQDRIREAHPEVSFWTMNGERGLTAPKRRTAGRAERLAIVQRAWAIPVGDLIDGHRSSGVARDDILDAMAACWTAERVLLGKSVSLPATPPTDSRGLRMEIVR